MPKPTSDVKRTRSSSRSESVRAALEAKKAALPDEWHPCMWCGAAIPPARVKQALLTKQEPKFCGDACRRLEPARSLVNRIFACALGAGKGDEAAWKLDFDTRLAMALHGAAPAKKGGRK